MSQYSVYKTSELIKKLDEVEDDSPDVINFFKNFKFSSIINQNIAKTNSTYVFKNVIKEDTTKSKIVMLLNKLHQQNITKITASFREIVFQTQDEIQELVNQCIQKIKRDSEQTRPLVAALCFELLKTYFVTTEGEKIFFRKLLLSEVKKEYIFSIDYENSEWSKEKAEKVMILIGTLYNNKIIDPAIMTSIINDFKKKIEYVDVDITQEGNEDYYEKVENSINLLSCFVSCIVLNEDSKKIYDNLDIFLDEQVTIYEGNRRIQKKVRLACKNIIYELRKA